MVNNKVSNKRFSVSKVSAVDSSSIPNEGLGSRFFSFLKLLVFLYLFILALTLLKDAAFEVGKSLFSITTTNIHPLKAFGIGWLITLIVQSSSATTATFAAMNSAGVAGFVVVVFAIIGSRIGTSFTSMLASLIVPSKKKKDLRHGFEIALANLIYAVPIAIIMFFLELFFHIFSDIGKSVTTSIPAFNFSFIDTITAPIRNGIEILNPWIIMIISLLLLAFSMEFIPKAIIGSFGKNNARRLLHKYLKNKWSSFFIGMIFTILVFSASITITLLIPLVIARLVKIKNLIPYMIGAHVGGASDVILAGLVIGKGASTAVITYLFFSIIGLLWLFFTDELLWLTKRISKNVLSTSRLTVLLFVISFILIALSLAFLL